MFFKSHRKINLLWPLGKLPDVYGRILRYNSQSHIDLQQDISYLST